MKIQYLVFVVFVAAMSSSFTDAPFLAKQITGGFYHTCALSSKNQIKCWGDNSYGQLGLGDKNDRGDNPNEMGDNLKSVDLGTDFFPISISAAGYHTCALSAKNQVKCWGYNRSGQLGLGDKNSRGDNPNEMGDNLKSVDLGSDFFPALISVGSFYSCALSTKNQIKCWGENYDCQLGAGDRNNRGDDLNEMGDNLKSVDLGTNFVPISISAGWGHTCALSKGNRIKCWGTNSFGQLGLGDKDKRGGSPNEMGDSLKSIDLVSDFVPTLVVTGQWHTCALSTKNQVKCWGYNNAGQLGLGDKNDRGDSPNEMGDNLTSVDLGADFVPTSISSGGYHTCAFSKKNQIKCWGDNYYGQLGLGDIDNRSDDPNEMGDNLKTIDFSSSIFPYGIFAGYAHSCAIAINRTTNCWGGNYEGQLGLGDKKNRGDDPNEMSELFVDL